MCSPSDSGGESGFLVLAWLIRPLGTNTCLTRMMTPVSTQEMDSYVYSEHMRVREGVQRTLGVLAGLCMVLTIVFGSLWGLSEKHHFTTSQVPVRMRIDGVFDDHTSEDCGLYYDRLFQGPPAQDGWVGGPSGSPLVFRYGVLHAVEGAAPRTGSCAQKIHEAASNDGLVYIHVNTEYNGRQLQDDSWPSSYDGEPSPPPPHIQPGAALLALQNGRTDPHCTLRCFGNYTLSGENPIRTQSPLPFSVCYSTYGVFQYLSDEKPIYETCGGSVTFDHINTRADVDNKCCPRQYPGTKLTAMFCGASKRPPIGDECAGG